MALGGGTFLTQNKILPGAYVNFISVANASATLSDRGIATIPLEMNWGPEGEVITVELGEFQKNSQKIFGYAYTADELKPMREIFKHAQTVHFFRLNSSGARPLALMQRPNTPAPVGMTFVLSLRKMKTVSRKANCMMFPLSLALSKWISRRPFLK